MLDFLNGPMRHLGCRNNEMLGGRGGHTEGGECVSREPEWWRAGPIARHCSISSGLARHRVSCSCSGKSVLPSARGSNLDINRIIQ